MNVAIITSPDFTQHVTPLGHVEAPERVVVVEKALREIPNLVWLHPRRATEEELCLAHTASYVELVKQEVEKLAKEITFLSTGDVTICPASFDVASLASGAVLSAVDAVMKKEVSHAFCAVRPPGHHATASQGMGFCLFNNVAIGARYVQKKYGIKRVLVVDWDLHHGNGTEAIFYGDPSLFYFSTHQSGIYPGTGNESKGTIVNCPLQAGRGSREALFAAFHEQLVPKMEEFQPEFVFISAGFDAHRDDPLGQLQLTEEDFYVLTIIVNGIADKWAEKRIVSVLEGGYNLRALAASTKRHVEGLL